MKNKKICAQTTGMSLGVWEQLNNLGSNSLEFEGIRTEDAQYCFEQAPQNVQAQTLFTIGQGSL
ncbi:hypothetical protein D3C84_589690 [compost metagenome]